MSFLSVWPFFRGYVSFREGNSVQIIHSVLGRETVFNLHDFQNLTSKTDHWEILLHTDWTVLQSKLMLLCFSPWTVCQESARHNHQERSQAHGAITGLQSLETWLPAGHKPSGIPETCGQSHVWLDAHVFLVQGVFPLLEVNLMLQNLKFAGFCEESLATFNWLLYISFLSFKPLCHISRLFHNHHLVQEPADIIQLHSSQDRLSLRKWRLMKLKYYNLPSCSWFVASDEQRGVLFQHGSFFWAIITPGYRKIGMMYIILANLGSPLLAPLSLVVF